jgi:hypothetical protein
VAQEVQRRIITYGVGAGLDYCSGIFLIQGEHMDRKSGITFAIAAILLAAAQPVLAEEMIPPGEEQFKFFAGGVLAWIDSGVGVNGTVSTGSLIDLEADGAGKNANNFILGGQWRFAPRHRISGMYFTTRKERSVSFDQTVTIGDDTLVPPTTLSSDSRNRFLLVDYRYSFVKNEDVELAGVLGAYINKFTVDLAGNANVQNNTNGTITTTNRAVSYSPGVTVPMPLIGGSIDWFVTPRFTIGGSLSGLKAKIGDVDGSIYVAAVSAEYMFTRNLGGGISFMHADLDVDVTKPNFNGELNWKNDNLLAYLLLKF